MTFEANDQDENSAASADAADERIWCSLTECRLRLADEGDRISQPKLTEYLQNNSEIPRRKSAIDRRVLEIDFLALRDHRRANVRVQDTARARGTALDDDAASLRMRERRAAAELREFELAQRRGDVIQRTDVQLAMHAAAVTLRQTLQRTRFDRAEALEAVRGAREKASLLAAQDEALQEAFAEALKGLAGLRIGDDRDTGTDGADESALGTAGAATES